MSAFDAASVGGSVWTLEKIGKSYVARALLIFLEHVPDRHKVEEALALIGKQIFDYKLVELDPSASGEVHTPLDYAPSPESMMRPLFPNEVITARLDALVAAQQPDGGWLCNWLDWNPASTLEWRGWQTVEKLLVLSRYGRLSGGGEN